MPGKTLYVADFNAIEARVLLWLAGDEEGLNIFRQKRDIYSEMATTIYGYPVNRKLPEHEEQGKLGKEAILALGYQMGASKFVSRAAKFGIVLPEDIYCKSCAEGSKKHQRRDAECDEWEPIGDPDVMTAVKVVDAYRAKFWRVKQLWQDQEAAAIKVVNSGRAIRAGKVAWELGQTVDFLYCTLPSGRKLAYPEPSIVDKKVPWGGTKPSLTYMGVNPLNPKDRRWARQTAYGGLIVENETQAVARDLMAAAMLRCEASGTYSPILSVHDELIAEADEGTGDVHEFEQLMAECPPWGRGIPVTAEGWSGGRYRKG